MEVQETQDEGLGLACNCSIFNEDHPGNYEKFMGVGGSFMRIMQRNHRHKR